MVCQLAWHEAMLGVTPGDEPVGVSHGRVQNSDWGS